MMKKLLIHTLWLTDFVLSCSSVIWFYFSCAQNIFCCYNVKCSIVTMVSLYYWLTASFSGLQIFTQRKWSKSQSTGLSLWNIMKKSVIIGRSLVRNSLPGGHIINHTVSIHDNSIHNDKYSPTTLQSLSSDSNLS